ncbi:hypothetical protein BKA57DRAFT_228960 [Linnemannia elongata]|nr:hypothetical protein BKA57DRAFT_228960 [Linnemannia elongata]
MSFSSLFSALLFCFNFHTLFFIHLVMSVLSLSLSPSLSLFLIFFIFFFRLFVELFVSVDTWCKVTLFASHFYFTFHTYRCASIYDSPPFILLCVL